MSNMVAAGLRKSASSNLHVLCGPTFVMMYFSAANIECIIEKYGINILKMASNSKIKYRVL